MMVYVRCKVKGENHLKDDYSHNIYKVEKGAGGGNNGTDLGPSVSFLLSDIFCKFRCLQDLILFLFFKFMQICKNTGGQKS